jgi:hypothetical protein
MKEFYSGERIVPKKPVYYKTDEQPELWFTAEQVWEIRGAGKCEHLGLETIVLTDIFPSYFLRVHFFFLEGECKFIGHMPHGM